MGYGKFLTVSDLLLPTSCAPQPLCGLASAFAKEFGSPESDSDRTAPTPRWLELRRCQRGDCRRAKWFGLRERESLAGGWDSVSASQYPPLRRAASACRKQRFQSSPLRFLAKPGNP